VEVFVKLKQIADYVDAYYLMNRKHLSLSFWASLIALGTGLLAVAIGATIALKEGPLVLSVTSTTTGLITQLVGLGFFQLYNKNLKQLNVFYHELLQNQDIAVALELIEIAAEDQKATLTSALFGKLLSRNQPPLSLTPELVRAMAESKGHESNNK
jgi:hypothetical protein